MRDCSHEIKRYLLLRRKDQPRQHIKMQRLHFANKVCLVKVMVFPVVMCGCEILTIKFSADKLTLLNCGVGEDS